MEWITVIAIILGPILAIQIDKYIEYKRAKRNRKVNIFKTLMATRGSALSYTHVEALNRIDLEFSSDKKYSKVVEAWKEYFDNLVKKFEGEDGLKIWASKNEELLANLLYEMGQSLGYDFDKVLIKRNIYSPVGHAKDEEERKLIKQGLIDLLNGNTALPVNFVSNEDDIDSQKELRELMTQYYKEQLTE